MYYTASGIVTRIGGRPAHEVEQWLATAPQHIPTQHMLPQHLVTNTNSIVNTITLARYQAP